MHRFIFTITVITIMLHMKKKKVNKETTFLWNIMSTNSLKKK